MSRSAVLALILLSVLLLNCRETFGRRGRTRGRNKSRVQIGLPITGKYRDPESDQYYNNNNVRRRGRERERELSLSAIVSRRRPSRPVL